jgi:hypothetical protein
MRADEALLRQAIAGEVRPRRGPAHDRRPRRPPGRDRRRRLPVRLSVRPRPLEARRRPQRLGRRADGSPPARCGVARGRGARARRQPLQVPRGRGRPVDRRPARPPPRLRQQRPLLAGPRQRRRTSSAGTGSAAPASAARPGGLRPGGRRLHPRPLRPRRPEPLRSRGALRLLEAAGERPTRPAGGRHRPTPGRASTSTPTSPTSSRSSAQDEVGGQAAAYAELIDGVIRPRMEAAYGAAEVVGTMGSSLGGLSRW